MPPAPAANMARDELSPPTSGRFATAQQKLIAEYNIACCCAAMGDRPRAMGILRSYVSRIEAGDRLSEVDDMIAEPDLASVRSDLQTLRSEMKEELAQQQGRGFFGTTIRDLADKVCQPHAFVYPWIICGRDDMCIDGPTTHSFMHNSSVRARAYITAGRRRVEGLADAAAEHKSAAGPRARDGHGRR